MKVRGHDLISRQRLEMISARERERRINRARSRLRAGVKIHRHALPRSRPGALQREVLAAILGTAIFLSHAFLALRLHDPERVRMALSAIPVVAQVVISL